MKKISNNIYLYWIAFCAMSICYALIFIWFPKSQDDWSYLFDFLRIGVDNDGHHSLIEGIKGCVAKRYTIDVARTGNIVGALLLLVPRWIPASICAMAWTFGLWLMTLLAGFKPGNFKHLALMLFLSTFALPWHEWGFNQMYAFNYVVIIPFFLCAELILFGCFSCRSGLALLLGVLVGCWHESYALALITSGIVLSLSKREIPSKNNCLLIAGAIIGLAFILAFPSHWLRLDYLSGIRVFHTGIRRLPYLWVWFISAIIFCFIAIKRKSLSDSLGLIVLITGLVLIPFAVITNSMRVAWPACILAVCYVTRFAGQTIKSKCINNIFVGLLIYLFTLFHLIAFSQEIYLHEKSLKQIEKAVAFADKDEMSVFAPIRKPSDASIMSLGRTNFSFYQPDDFTLMYLRFLTGNVDVNVVPEELRDYDGSMNNRCGETSGIHLYNGWLVMDSYDGESEKQGTVYYKHYKEYTTCFIIPFKGADGKIYYYIYPKQSSLGGLMGEYQYATF